MDFNPPSHCLFGGESIWKGWYCDHLCTGFGGCWGEYAPGDESARVKAVMVSDCGLGKFFPLMVPQQLYWNGQWFHQSVQSFLVAAVVPSL